MRQRAWREARGETAGDLVTEHEGGEDVAAGPARCFADREPAGQYLQRRLARDKAQPLAKLYCASGGTVEQCGGARVLGGPATRIDRRAGPGAGGQPLAQLPYFRPVAAGEDDA